MNDSDYIVGLISVGIVFTAFLIMIINITINYRNSQTVKNTSTKYHAILDYVKSIEKINVKNEYRYIIYKNTKRQVENVNSYYEMCKLVFFDEEISRLAVNLIENRKTIIKFKDFCNDVSETPLNIMHNSGIPMNIYHLIEEKYINRLKKPVFEEPVIYLTFQYTTPKTKKTTSKQYKYSVDDIVKIFIDVDESGKKLTNAEAERRKMSQSLRYDVLKRDRFRCVICSRSAEDGVKLHVDHIIPVSKGGKTELRNLRTLCEDCNFGKKAKYDPEGIN